MNAGTNNQQSQNSSPYPSTEYKQIPLEACRLDMEPRESRRDVKFGEDEDSEEPSHSDISYHELRPMDNASSDSNQESEYDPQLEQKIEQIKQNLKNNPSITDTNT